MLVDSDIGQLNIYLMAFKSRTIAFVANTHTKHIHQTQMLIRYCPIYTVCLLFTHMYMHMDTLYAHAYAYTSHTEHDFTIFLFPGIGVNMKFHSCSCEPPVYSKQRIFISVCIKVSPKFVILYAHMYMHIYTHTHT